MKLKQDFLDKIKLGEDFEYIIDNKLSKIIVEPLENNYTLLLQYSSSNIKNKLIHTTISPLAILNDKDEIVYFPMASNYRVQNLLNSIVQYKDETKSLDEVTDFRMKMSNFQTTMLDDLYDTLMKNLPLLNKKIIKSMDLEEYREKAIEKYKKKQDLEVPIAKTSIALTQDLLVYYITDKKKLEDNILDCLSDYSLANYERYVAEKECIRQYVEYIETNPDFKRQSDICAIIDGDKQSYAINYHDQKGNKLKHSFKKNISRMEALNKTVLDYQVLDKIPIELIDTISWRNNILFDSQNYSSTKISEEETAVKLGLLDKFDEINPKYLNDPKVMYQILMSNINAFKYMSPALQLDTDFIVKVMAGIKQEKSDFIDKCYSSEMSYTLRNASSKKNIYTQLSPTLKKDKRLLIEYIKLLSEKEYGQQFSSPYPMYGSSFSKEFQDAISLYVSSYEFSKLLIDKVGFNEQIIDMIPEEFLNRQEMLDLLKEKMATYKTPCAAYKKMSSIKNLKFLYDDLQIKRNICMLSDEVLNDKKFVCDNLSDYALSTDRIFNLYKYDEEVMDKLLVSFSSETHCQKYLDYSEISRSDSLKMFELCSKNIGFITRLSDDDKKIFIDGELSEIENVYVSIDNSINIVTPNCTLKIRSTRGNAAFSFVDNNNTNLEAWFSRYSNAGQHLETKVLEILQKNFKLRSKLYESVVDEVINNYKPKPAPER